MKKKTKKALKKRIGIINQDIYMFNSNNMQTDCLLTKAEWDESWFIYRERGDVVEFDYESGEWVCPNSCSTFEAKWVTEITCK